MIRAATILVFAAFMGGAASAHPFDDRAEMICDVLLIKEKSGAEAMRLVVQYRYEDGFASYNEAYNELDDNHDDHISAAERDNRFKELAKDLMDVTRLKVRGKLATLIPNYGEFSLADLVNADNNVDLPKGMDIKLLRIGYYFTFDIKLPESLDAGLHRVELHFASTRVKMEDRGNQLRAFDDRAPRRRAISVTYDRTPEGFDVVRFNWDVKTSAVGDKTPEPPKIAEEKPPANAPANESAQQPDKRKAGEDILRETDSERRNAQSANSRISDAFRKLRDGGADPLVWLAVLGTMFLLGGYHAVQPGHGKTLVAGYLIGTQGRQSDAVFLGIVVTAAHTSGVLLLMFAAWAVSEIWPGAMQNPAIQMAEWITLAVGATILLMGIGLVMKRAGDRGHTHEMFGRHVDGGHTHDHTHDSNPELPLVGGPMHEHHDHADEHHEHTHSHNHGHERHDHPSTGSEQAAHSHDHGHSHDHSHSHGLSHEHLEHDPARMTRWEVLRLGILGGIVPCPSAFVIALFAFQAQLYLTGLIMVIVFSLGLAVVLATIGLVLVNTKQYLNEKRRTTRSGLYLWLEAKLPVFGALMITLIGGAMVLLAAIRLGWVDPGGFSV